MSNTPEWIAALGSLIAAVISAMVKMRQKREEAKQDNIRDRIGGVDTEPSLTQQVAALKASSIETKMAIGQLAVQVTELARQNAMSRVSMEDMKAQLLNEMEARTEKQLEPIKTQVVWINDFMAKVKAAKERAK
jgi:hypothetical protein